MNKRKRTIRRFKKSVYRHHIKHPCKSKTERLKKKRIIRHNRNLLRKYPWLVAVDWHWNPIDTDEFTILDDMSRGWRQCFGMLLVKDIDKALKGKEFHSEQLKSKYGALRWYFSASADVYNEIQDIIRAYEVISENVCESCGQVDVGATSGWIMPLCRKCFYKDEYHADQNYYEHISPWNRMALERRFRRYDSEAGEWKNYTVDISEYTNKVRVNYWKHHK